MSGESSKPTTEGRRRALLTAVPIPAVFYLVQKHPVTGLTAGNTTG